MKTLHLSRRSAFTLLEIMLVVAIIALLLGAGFTYLGDAFGFATEVRVKGDIQRIGGQLKNYSMFNGFYPTPEQGLKALVTAPQSEPRPTRWKQFMEEIPKDPWGSEYVYVQPGMHNPNSFDLYTIGKDRKPGTDDDVGNWTGQSNP